MQILEACRVYDQLTVYHVQYASQVELGIGAHAHMFACCIPVLLE